MHLRAARPERLGRDRRAKSQAEFTHAGARQSELGGKSGLNYSMPFVCESVQHDPAKAVA